MGSFTVWTLKSLHAKQEMSRLSKISNVIDWNPIRQILDEMYDNKSVQVRIISGYQEYS